MKKICLLGLMFVCLFVAVGFSGCIGSDPIVGTWSERTLGATIVFNADKTFTANIPTMGISMGGKWANQGNGQYSMIYPATGQSYTCQMSSDGKTMTSGYGYLTETYIKIS
jgi:hypothetical protein